jgi:hypothetical protein
MATTAAARPAMEDIRAFAKPLQVTVEWVGELGLFCWRVAKAVFSRPFESAEFFRQLDAIGTKSLPHQHERLFDWVVIQPALRPSAIVTRLSGCAEGSAKDLDLLGVVEFHGHQDTPRLPGLFCAWA